MPTALLDYVPATLRSLAERAARAVGAEVNWHPFGKRLAGLCDRLDIRAALDVGAGGGQYAGFLRHCGFRGHIVSCEPVGRTFDELVRAAAADPDWHPERLAVGAAPGDVEAPVTAGHPRAAPGFGHVRAERTPVSTVDELFDSYGYPPERALLKVGGHGQEWAVLDGAARSLPRLAAAQVELPLIPLHAGQRLIGDITARLERAGLALWWLEPGSTDPAAGRIARCDGVFVRQDP
ncbi:FkbM family methyltransferase [Actinokineospora pegani]|uniref:FkbM family methyltransferase n=1 Tax=Actinokineospora pegani TaxID=2654637 RepID=UPI0018D3B02D|nr:FkbM family methyltransferase [Actinokineospora pegani]